MENWKIVDECDAYEVSDLGRVRRNLPGDNTYAGRIVVPCLNKSGYLALSLCKDNKKINRLVSRLVAKAFIPNPLGLPEVNHLKEKTNNEAENLEWATRKVNFIHAVVTGRMPAGSHGVVRVKATGKFVARCNFLEKRHIGTFDTREEAEAARDAKLDEVMKAHNVSY